LARLLDAHLAASVCIGSTLSHFRQTSLVRPVLSVIAIRRFLHRAQRLESIGVPYCGLAGGRDLAIHFAAADPVPEATLQPRPSTRLTPRCN
jgi:hypothetical protein